MQKKEIDGIVILNKSQYVSSNTACNKVKYILNAKKAGHLGTLDPLATGVLPISLGKATKLFDIFLKKRKTYIASFDFTHETDTLDVEGVILNNSKKSITPEDINKVLKEFVGTLNQIPPKYSAKKVNGVRAYDLARKGVSFELKSKQITIYRFELIGEVKPDVYKFVIECSSGTYIRSLCRDLAYAMGVYGTMIELIRTKCGIFNIDDSCTIDDIQKGKYKLFSIEEILEKVNLDE